MKLRPILALCFISFLCIANYANAAKSAKSLAPQFNYEPWHYPIDTNAPGAQKYFDQALLLFYDGDYTEAVRAFKASVELDGNCGLCYFGLALALGSKTHTIATGLERKQALRAIKQGLLLESLSEKQEDLLEALSNRYYRGETDQKTPFNISRYTNTIVSQEERFSFATSMRKLAKKYPDDIEIRALFAYALFDLSQHVFYLPNEGTPTKYTSELEDTLREILDRTPNHPGAMHYYIHVISQSHNPYEAKEVAQRLRTAYPNLHHLSQLPAEIYLQTGKLHDATDANQQAIAAYNRYKATCEKQGFSPAANFLEHHNYQMLWLSASLEGRTLIATQAVEALDKITPDFLIKQAVDLQAYPMTRYLNAVRFYDWDSLTKVSPPDARYYFLRGMFLYAQGLAYTKLGDLFHAERNRDNLIAITERGENEEVLQAFGHTQLNIALEILSAEIAQMKGQNDIMLHHWKNAMKFYKQRNVWFPPILTLDLYRGLTHAHMTYKQYPEALSTISAYLEHYPKVPWAYHDQSTILNHLDEAEKAKETQEDFVQLWRYSGINFPG